MQIKMLITHNIKFLKINKILYKDKWKNKKRTIWVKFINSLEMYLLNLII